MERTVPVRYIFFLMNNFHYTSHGSFFLSFSFPFPFLSKLMFDDVMMLDL